ncbi:TetR/AcrR family transcriptional regulator [Paenibacillus sp. D2_2]|uniref:TetR/AcrR family transcriptional regulator n=1 Tax=Paenibacillus sp. D2_2 TaxID=3073092 RepID=UPI0028157C5E|nr:TetR/AcrR family transcriptional regulator [Paenibacillus sp. D2_2]WMT41213.1 TetR/AcrR family transcriptional regulator [Paenibacillus sp. D2_2]
MSKSSQRTASFELILETAEQLILEKGCRQTTLQDIIERSGLSKGAIYHYVSGKDELFGLILKSKFEALHDRFTSAVAETAVGDAVPPIKLITGGMMDSGSVTNKIFTYLLGQCDNEKIMAILRELYQFSLKMAIDWIETGQKANAIPKTVDAHKIASLFIIFTYGMRVHHVIAEVGDEGIQFDDVFRFISGALH